MATTYLPIRPFRVEEVSFYVIASQQPVEGIFGVLHGAISVLTDRQKITLQVAAVTDQETAGNLIEMGEMEKYSRRFLGQAKRRARKAGFHVTSSYFFGIMHPDNLAVLRRSPKVEVWECPITSA